MIPKVIHYCWFGGKPLPRLAKKCIASWERLCPDFEIRRWDESNFDVRQVPFIASAYSASAWAFVSDWARLKIVYDEGGVYLDTDVKLLKPLDSLLDSSCYIGVQQAGRLCNTGLGFGAIKASPVVRALLAEYDGIDYRPEHAVDIACPHLNDRVIRAFGYMGNGMGDVARLPEITVYPCRYFDPIAPGDSEDLMGVDTISVHCYAYSWGSTANRLRRSALNLIGVDRVGALKQKLGW
jgi:hypothetical protein